MSEPADNVLAVLSHQGRLKVEGLYDASAKLGLAPHWTNLENLARLGHCEINWKTRHVEASPAALARLPTIGTPQAVLCGARTPRFLQQVVHTAESLGAQVKITKQTAAPSRVLLSADSRTLSSLSATCGIHYFDVPPAYQLAAASPSLGDIVKKWSWRNDGKPPTSRYFNPATRQFDNTVRQPGLAEMPGRFQAERIHFAVQGTTRAQCDLDWGRHWAIADAGQTALRYNRTVLRTDTPLPSLLTRAATLCTGQLPHFANGVLQYPSVPNALFQLIASKLSRSTQP